MLRPLPLAAVLLLAATANANAQADLNANAALKYWRAFSHLPKLDKEEQEKIVHEAATMPLTPRLKDVVRWSEGSLHELHNGAAVADCAWGITYDDGISVTLPECAAARLLAGVACLRARLRFEEGKNAGALDDVFAALTLGRHLSRGSIINVHVGIAVELVVIDALAANLPRLDEATLKSLPARLNKLPESGSMADELRREEKVFLGWFLRKVEGIKDRDKLIEFLDYCQGGAGQKDQFAQGKALLEACGGTSEGVVKYGEASRPFYATFAKAMVLSPEELDKAVEAEKKNTDKNPVFKLLAPGLVKSRQAEVRREVRRAMLRAAIAVQLDGKDALKGHPEPFGDGPFACEAFTGGFELKSKRPAKDKPWSLTVGRRP